MLGAASRISLICASLNHLFVGTPVLNVSFLNETIWISIPACSAAYASKAFVTYSSVNLTFPFLLNKSYEKLVDDTIEGLKNFIKDVNTKKFPTPSNIVEIKDDEFEKFLNKVG